MKFEAAPGVAVGNDRRGVARVWFSFVRDVEETRGATAVSKTVCVEKAQTSPQLFIHTDNCPFFSPGPGWDIRAGRGGRKWHLWTSLQGWFSAGCSAWPALVFPQ